jgi:hypothetical protein
MDIGVRDRPRRNCLARGRMTLVHQLESMRRESDFRAGMSWPDVTEFPDRPQDSSGDQAGSDAKPGVGTRCS